MCERVTLNFNKICIRIVNVREWIVARKLREAGEMVRNVKRNGTTLDAFMMEVIVARTLIATNVRIPWLR